jgi:HK97 gp10 family phage protein
VNLANPLQNIMADAIVIEGLKELSDRLAEMPAKAAKRYLSRAGEKAAEVVIEALEQTVPVDVGYLEETLTWQKKWDGEDDTTMIISIGAAKGAFWGSLQEYGTRFQKPQRWMSTAWESCKGETLNVFATEAIGILMDLENKD